MGYIFVGLSLERFLFLIIFQVRQSVLKLSNFQFLNTYYKVSMCFAKRVQWKRSDRETLRIKI